MVLELARTGLVFTLLAGLAACGSPRQEESATNPTEAASASGPTAPAAFAQCTSCHSVEPGKNGVGPSLAGIYGTKAGDVPNFAFSEALKGSGLTWDDATLDKWLAGPMALVPGTRMTYAGQADPAKRQELIAYLKSLK